MDVPNRVGKHDLQKILVDLLCRLLLEGQRLVKPRF